MQAVVEKTTLTIVKNEEETLTSLIDELLKLDNTSDNSLKSNIENKIVALGKAALPKLIEIVLTKKGTARGIAAMCLIRIGDDAAEYILKASKLNTEFEWIGQYLIKEIRDCNSYSEAIAV